jgi:predicted transcriptional regulator
VPAVALSYVLEKNFTREEAIQNLLAVTQSLVSLYLTKKGRSVVGDLMSPGGDG